MSKQSYTVIDLKVQVGESVELMDYLNEFNEAQKLSLDDIVAKLEAPLNRTDKIFMFMKECSNRLVFNG